MNNLKNLRIEKNISRPELAERTGIKLRVLEAYEQGNRDIDGAKIETLLNLSLVLGCNISDLIENENLKEKLKSNGY